MRHAVDGIIAVAGTHSFGPGGGPEYSSRRLNA